MSESQSSYAEMAKDALSATQGHYAHEFKEVDAGNQTRQTSFLRYSGHALDANLAVQWAHALTRGPVDTAAAPTDEAAFLTALHALDLYACQQEAAAQHLLAWLDAPVGGVFAKRADVVRSVWTGFFAFTRAVANAAKGTVSLETLVGGEPSAHMPKWLVSALQNREHSKLLNDSEFAGWVKGAPTDNQALAFCIRHEWRALGPNVVALQEANRRGREGGILKQWLRAVLSPYSLRPRDFALKSARPIAPAHLDQPDAFASSTDAIYALAAALGILHWLDSAHDAQKRQHTPNKEKVKDAISARLKAHAAAPSTAKGNLMAQSADQLAALLVAEHKPKQPANNNRLAAVHGDLATQSATRCPLSANWLELSFDEDGHFDSAVMWQAKTTIALNAWRSDALAAMRGKGLRCLVGCKNSLAGDDEPQHFVALCMSWGLDETGCACFEIMVPNTAAETALMQACGDADKREGSRITQADLLCLEASGSVTSEFVIYLEIDDFEVP